MISCSEHTVLIIDDEESIRLSYAEYLEDLGYEIITAKNGREGLEKFSKKKVDLVLVDLRMPEIDGLEVMARIREKSPDTPMIVISGTGVINDAVEALHQGAWDYLLKPLADMSILKHTVESVLEKVNLKRENAEYQIHLEQRNKELIKAMNSAVDANRRKSDFLAHICHELRNPMNGILGFSEILVNGEISDENKEYASFIHNSSKQLINLVNDILDSSKIESGKMEIQHSPFKLIDVLNYTMDICSFSAQLKGLDLKKSLTPSQIPVIVGDQFRLSQILVNLVNNAIKFTSTGEVSISVEVESIKNKRVKVNFSVKDTGIGIPKDRLTMIMEAYKQADPSHSQKGTGLGLLISSRLCQLMGGKLEVVSKVNEGSNFYFTLDFPIAD